MARAYIMIQVAYPWVFIALFIPFIIYFFVPKATTKNPQALKVPFFNELLSSFANIRSFGGSTNLSWLKYMVCLIWLLLVISGSGIQWLGKPLSLPQTGRDLLIAIDLSGSMQTPDMVINGDSKTRIDVVKQVASKFIGGRVGDRLGLILFGSQAYLQTPLTFDRKTVGQMLNDATVGIAGEQTAIGDAIGLAVKRLIEYPGTSKALILLTDGGNNSGVLAPVDAAKIAAREHIKIYTIGIGATKMKVQTMFGTQTVNPSSDLDIEGLKQIASITGGQFFRAEDGNSLEAVYAQINKLEPVKADSITIRPITPLYPWSLGLALVLSFILILLKVRRR